MAGQRVLFAFLTGNYLYDELNSLVIEFLKNKTKAIVNHELQSKSLISSVASTLNNLIIQHVLPNESFKQRSSKLLDQTIQLKATQNISDSVFQKSLSAEKFEETLSKINNFTYIFDKNKVNVIPKPNFLKSSEKYLTTD